MKPCLLYYVMVVVPFTYIKAAYNDRDKNDKLRDLCLFSFSSLILSHCLVLFVGGWTHCRSVGQ